MSSSLKAKVRKFAELEDASEKTTELELPKDLFYASLREKKTAGYNPFSDTNKPHWRTEGKIIADKLGIRREEGPLISQQEVDAFTAKCIENAATFRNFIAEYFKDYTTNPRESIEIILQILDHNSKRLSDAVYHNAFLLAIVLMDHLTVDDCKKIAGIMNDGSFYYDPATGERSEYESSDSEEEDSHGYEGEHILWTNMQILLACASSTFVQVYCEMVLSPTFWENSARREMALESIKPELIAFHAPQHIARFMDLFTYICSKPRFKSHSTVGTGINGFESLGVFRKVLPLVTEAYKNQRTTNWESSELISYYPKNGICPAASDIPFLISLADNITVLAHRDDDQSVVDEMGDRQRTRYMKEIGLLAGMKNMCKMFSDQIECNAIGCSKIGKIHKVPEGTIRMRHCSGCKLRCYCSTECQKKNWEEGHNKMCKYFRSINLQ